jgi:hypothetical protein
VNNENYPSLGLDDANPIKKGNAWYLQMAKHIWANWQHTASRSFAGGIGRYNRMEYYARGKQPIDQYKPMLGIDDKENHTWMAIDMSPLPVAPKLLRIIHSLFRKIDMSPDVQAIDAYSVEDKNEYYEKEFASIQMRKILAAQGISDNVLNTDDPSQPKTEEELEIHKQFTYKHRLAMKVEEALDKVYLDNGYEEEREKTREHLINKGAGGYRIWTDEKGKVCYRSVDPSAFGSSYTLDPYMADLWYAFEVTFVLISELREKLPNVSEKELQELAAKFSRQHGNPIKFGNTSSGSYSYDGARIPVLDLVFKAASKVPHEKRVLKNGNFVLGKTNKVKSNTEKKTYYEDESMDVHTLKWVMESDLVYDFKLESDQVKKASRYWDATLPFIMTAPSIFKMETYSLMEEIIPYIDAFHIAWYKMQNVIAQARPQGIQIEIGALEDVSLSGNGETLTPMQLMDLYAQKGIVIYRKIAADGTATNYSPVSELKGGLGEEADHWLNIMEREMNMIKSAIGLNDFTDGSTPDPKSLNGVGNMAAEATNNSLHHIFAAERNLLERLSDNAACRVYDSVVFKKSSYYDLALSKSTIASTIGKMKNYLREMGVTLRMAPNSAEKTQLNNDIAQAVANQQITIADKYAIMDIKNLKQAEMVLAYRIKVNAEEAQKREMAKIKATTDQQQQSAVVAEQEKRKTVQFETQQQLMIDNNKYDREERLKTLEYGLKSGIQSEAHDGKREITEMTNDSQQQIASQRHQPQAA